MKWMVAGLAMWAAPGAAQAQDVALVYCGLSFGFETQLHADLSALGAFGSIDLISSGSTPVTAAALAPYDSVMYWASAGCSVNGQNGDGLADHVDAGGGLVMAEYTTAVSVLTGRWANQGYHPLTDGPATSGGGPLGLVAVDPVSPLLAGVASFSGGSDSIRPGGTFRPGVTQVATWSDGAPLLGHHRPSGGGTVVALGMWPYPASYDAAGLWWDDATDGFQLIVNALQVAATPECPAVDGAFPEAAGLLVVGDSCGAGDELGAPSCATGASSADQAYDWSPPFSGIWQLETVGAAFDHTLSVVDAACGAELACDLGSAAPSTVTVEAARGTTYGVVVDGVGACGAYSLTASCDEPYYDLDLGGAYYTSATVQQSTCTSDDDFPNCAFPGSASGDMAFRWTASVDGTFQINTFGTNWDTTITVLDPSDCSVSQCNDEAESSLWGSSEVFVPALAGASIYFVIDGAPGECGQAELTIGPCPDGDGDGVCDFEDPCPVDNPDDGDGDGICDSDFQLDASPVSPGQVLALSATNAPPGAQVWFALSRAGTGGGACVPSDNGPPVCVTIRRPILLGRASADASGTASISRTVPAGVPVGATVWFQALVRTGNGDVTPEVEVVTTLP